MFKHGDKYIHFTKYGGVNKGEVEWYGETINWDTDNMVAYHIPYIKSTKGIVIRLNGEDGKVFKIKNDITEEMLNKLKSSTEVFKVLKERKEQIKAASIKNAEKRVNEIEDYLSNSNINDLVKNV
jgi:predicted DNA-binding protein (MmcQ/YjbR family)